MERLIVCAALVLLLVALPAQADTQPEGYQYGRYNRPPHQQGSINTPRDFVRAWQRREAPARINPCLALSVPASKDFVYAPGFDLMWFSGWRSIRQFLKWRQELRPSGDITLYIAGAQGFVGDANDESMLLFVWDQCSLEAATRTQRQVPGPAYFADYIFSRGIEIPDQVLREVIFNYWPGTNNTLYGASCDRGCLAGVDWTKAPPAACGCNPKLVAEMKRFSALDPGSSTLARPSPDTRSCLQLLNSGGEITIDSFRAAVNFCFNASPLQTGNGLGWRPATDDGYKPGFYELLSFPEYVQPNYSVQKLRALASLAQVTAYVA